MRLSLRFSGQVQLVVDPAVDPEHAGGITCPLAFNVDAKEELVNAAGDVLNFLLSLLTPRSSPG